jgi:hypothetical protein
MLNASIIARQYDLTIIQGATFRCPITWKDETGSIVPLAGRAAWLHIRSPVDASTTLFTLTTANGRISVANTDPNITLVISDEDTATLNPWGEAIYDLLVELANGDRRRILQGIATVSPSATRGV